MLCWSRRMVVSIVLRHAQSSDIGWHGGCRPLSRPLTPTPPVFNVSLSKCACQSTLCGHTLCHVPSGQTSISSCVDQMGHLAVHGKKSWCFQEQRKRRSTSLSTVESLRSRDDRQQGASTCMGRAVLGGGLWRQWRGWPGAPCNRCDVRWSWR